MEGGIHEVLIMLFGTRCKLFDDLNQSQAAEEKSNTGSDGKDSVCF